MVINHLTLLQELAATADEQERKVFPFKHPSLLARSTQESLGTALSQLPVADRNRLKPFLDQLQSLRERFEQRPESYPIGFGPIEDLVLQLRRREINEAYARQLAQQSEFIESLSPIYISALSIFNFNMTVRGQWRAAILQHRVLMAAVEAMAPSPTLDGLVKQVSCDWIAVVTGAVEDVPDGRLYRDAVAVGERMVGVGRQTKDTHFLGYMLYRLGALHLDPYTANRSSNNYQLGIRLWRQKLFSELGDEYSRHSEEEINMPLPGEAIERAEKYFREAVKHREGHEKGLTLKALAQTLRWQDVIKGKFKKREFRKICDEALRHLDHKRAPQQVLEIFAMLLSKGESINSDDARKLLQTPLNEYLESIGPQNTISLILQATAVLIKEDTTLGLKLIVDAGQIFREYGDENASRSRAEQILSLIREMFREMIPPSPPRGGLKGVVQKMLERAGREKWDEAKLGLGLVSLASISPDWDEEASGLELLSEAIRTATQPLSEIRDAVAYLQGVLWVGSGASAVNTAARSSASSEGYQRAVNAYTNAIEPFLTLGFNSLALDCLQRVEEVMSWAGDDPEVAQEVVLDIAPLASQLEVDLGGAATHLIQRLCKHALRIMRPHPLNPGVILFLFQIAKGLGFATSLHTEQGYDYSEDEYALDLLRRVREAEVALKDESQESDEPEELLEESTFLVAYAKSDERQSGDTPSERLANLQHRFDAYLNTKLLTGAIGQGQTFRLVKDVQAVLDSRTVLLNFYYGAVEAGIAGVYVVLITTEEVQLGVVQRASFDGKIIFDDSERQVSVHPLALATKILRDAVVADPWPKAVSRDAEELLSNDFKGYLGSVEAHLRRLKELGKDHLCIIPHGAMHFYPLHLLGDPNAPLANDWKISYLPNLYLLFREKTSTSIMKRPERMMTAIGLSFENNNPFNLSVMPQSVSETQNVSSLFGLPPLLNEQATREAVIEALTTSRYAHISTHGKHNVNAPAFQCLYLSPDSKSDGRLFAYELLSLDLQNLELLTLSACETALGRFDSADNLRGLLANFLLAGIPHIVGTLWPVAVEPSKQFFSELYRELKEGASYLDAFAVAQKNTKRVFPAYRDWGAFYMVSVPRN